MADTVKLFYEAAREAKSGDDLIEYASGLTDGHPESLADHLFNAAALLHIEAGANLDRFIKDTAEGRAADRERLAAEGRAKAAVDLAAAALEYTKAPDAETKQQAAYKLESIKAALLSGTAIDDRLGTWEDFEKECISYDPEADFRPALFAGLPFPSGTLSYIGARAKVGKTAAMVNIAREAITEGKRKVFFITLEMSRRQLLSKLILSLAFSYVGGTPTAGEFRTRGSIERKEGEGGTPTGDLYRIMKGRELSQNQHTPGTGAFIDAVNQARKELAAVYKKTLFIFDGRGQEFTEITNAIAQYAGPESVVLLDYIQRMPSAEKDNYNDTYMRVKLISDGVLRAANKNGCVIISGAQFNRTVAKNKDDQEMVELTSFRESGDIEQDGHNLIGMGRLATQGGRYIKMLAAREEMVEGDCYETDFVPAFSYMTLKRGINGKPQRIQISDIPKGSKTKSNNDPTTPKPGNEETPSQSTEPVLFTPPKIVQNQRGNNL